MKRIMTIASGKGGVGKTTLAVNLGLTLSHYGKTVLIDMDFETSSLRAFLNMAFKKDLYHFFKRNEPLEQCMTPLSRYLDPKKQFRNFYIIAAPKYYIDDLARFRKEEWRRFTRAVNTLPVDFVILDLKAGVSHDVLDLMPYSNSGLLIFTPRLPAATAAAAHLVKGQIFRKLKLMFSSRSVLLEGFSKKDLDDLHDALARTDDVYNDSIQNLDALVRYFRKRFKNHPATLAIERTLETFRVYYVLNHFNGIESSYRDAVEPFVRQLFRYVSSRITTRSVGWVSYSSLIHEANCRQIPIVLDTSLYPIRRGRKVPRFHELEEIAQQFGRTLLKEKKPKKKVTLQDYLTDQLTMMKEMYASLKNAHPVTEFRYISALIMKIINTERHYHFGDREILDARDLQKLMMKYYESQHQNRVKSHASQ